MRGHLSGPARFRQTLASGLAVFAALALTVVLLGYLPRDGFRSTRLLLFALVAGLAWASALGVVRDRPVVGGAGAAGVALLGFWQAALWIWLLPAAGLLLVGTALSTAGDQAGRGNSTA